MEIKNKEGEVVFCHTEDNNTLKKTVEVAVKAGVSLSYADLRCADLCCAELRNIKLSYADLILY